MTDWPTDLTPARTEFHLVTPNREAKSVLTGSSRFATGLTEFWKVKYTFRRMKPERWKRVSALITGMRGRSGTIDLFDPSGCDTQSPGATGSTTAAAVKYTHSVAVNISGQVKAGDRFQIGRWYYEAMNDVSGAGTLTFEPSLREALTSGTTITFQTPRARVRLTKDENPIERAEHHEGSITVEFVEDI